MKPLPETLTLSDVGDILVEALLPFYKGVPNGPDTVPEFRKSLTNEEASNLLTAIHHVVVAIRLQEREG